MINLFFSDPLVFLVVFPGLLLSISLHEFAHCWVTDKLGDPTPRAKGRLTLDPRAHLEPLGVIALLLTRFGWGKPAPYDPYNLREPIRDSAIIAVAGPITNLIIAASLAAFLKLGIVQTTWLGMSLYYTMLINVMLAIFNLVPVHPLDGSKILTALLPKQASVEYDSMMSRFGTLILIMLIFPWAGGASPISQLLSPIINLVVSILI